jgi:ubiquitin-conjugating enzyme E2 D/E
MNNALLSLRRIKMELNEINNSDTVGISIGLIDNDYYNLKAIIVNTDNSCPFYYKFLEFEIKLSEKYPFKEPKLILKTPIFHPNFLDDKICLNILRSDCWSPSLTLEKVLLSILSLLDDANPNDPLNVEAANLYINNREEYNKRVRLLFNKNIFF